MIIVRLTNDTRVTLADLFMLDLVVNETCRFTQRTKMAVAAKLLAEYDEFALTPREHMVLCEFVREGYNQLDHADVPAPIASAVFEAVDALDDVLGETK